ncbi:MAG: aminotransferase class III-fold pyridoxal phosphate-dependent enzyme, partial [Clostridia bacterium]|nr:aminotransferase class III-fold pyridoxal phosphate-dependent enzyme [Clostridia bacterium]
RTGNMYCYQNYGIEPDLVSTAKGLGGGLPIGACLFFEKTEFVFSYGDHGSTFAGNPVACAAGVSVVKRLNQELFDEVKRKGEYIVNALKNTKNVLGVSGMGLMIGIQTNKPARSVVQQCIEKGLFVLTAHDRVRLLPPLNITEAELEKGLKILMEIIEA